MVDTFEAQCVSKRRQWLGGGLRDRIAFGSGWCCVCKACTWRRFPLLRLVVRELTVKLSQSSVSERLTVFGLLDDDSMDIQRLWMLNIWWFSGCLQVQPTQCRASNDDLSAQLQPDTIIYFFRAYSKAYVCWYYSPASCLDFKFIWFIF